MSARDEVLATDPQMKVAMSIADQQGLNKQLVRQWYGEVCLGEITVRAFFDRISLEVTDPDLRRALLAVTPFSTAQRASAPIQERSMV